MTLEESIWIRKQLEKIKNASNALDIGSSSFYYRKVSQPYIDENIFAYLRKQNVDIGYLDLEEDEGVNIVADITNEKLTWAKSFDLVFCCSVLEHLLGVETAIKNISKSVAKERYLIITMPYKYRYHPDPIDNLERYSPDELKGLFPNFKVISSKVISYPPDIKGDLISILRAIKRRKIKGVIHNLRSCLYRKPKMSCLLLKKES